MTLPWLTAMMGFLISCSQAAVITNNLIRNGDFEEPGTPPPGWRVHATPGESYSLIPEAVTGKQAFSFSVPMPGNVDAITEPCTVAPGEDYLLTFWYRADGKPGKGNIYFYVWIVWQDSDGKTFQSQTKDLPCAPMPNARVATYTFPVPPNAVKASLKFSAIVTKDYQGADTTFTIDQVRLMQLSKMVIPPKSQTWEYASRYLYLGMQLADDPDATGGKAVLAELGKSHMYTNLFGGQFRADQPPGEYLVTYRLKVKDNTRKTPVVNLGITNLGNVNYGMLYKTLLATDFTTSGAYQDFTLRFIRPEDGLVDFPVTYLAAGTDVSFDKITVTQLASFATDQQIAEIWLGENINTKPPAIPPTPSPANNKVLVLAGLENTVCFPANALTLTMKLTSRYSYMARLQTGFGLDQAFPKNVEQLNDVNLIVMANIPATALNGFMGRRALRQFVERGGGLLIFGGPLSLGKGDFSGTAFEPALPITTTGPWDMVKATSPPVKVAKDSPITRGLRWNLQPLAYYYQRVTPRPGAETLLTCDGAPILVTGKYGNGRVAVFTATNIGEPATKQIPFYQWPDYLLLLTRVTQWLLKQ